MSSTSAKLLSEMDEAFRARALPTLMRYVEIDNRSPAFDPHDEFLDQTYAAVDLIANWMRDHLSEESRVERLDGIKRAPTLLIDIPGTVDRTVLCFGHLDKYPELEQWTAPFAPYEPRIEGDFIYGRGTVDNGYAPFAYALAHTRLKENGEPVPRMLMVLETGHKSLSIHVSQIFNHLQSIDADPDLILFLHAICADYDRLWYIQGYRGIIEGTLTVHALDKPSHSGASGMAPSGFGIAMSLISRVSDPVTGLVTSDIGRVKQPAHLTTGGAVTDEIAGRYFIDAAGLSRSGVETSLSPAEAAILPIWNAALTVADIEGVRSGEHTGGRLSADVALRLALRSPPTADIYDTADRLEQALCAEPPMGADIDFTPSKIIPGWHNAEYPAWLDESLQEASRVAFGSDAIGWSIGGAYPVVELVSDKFPKTPVLMTGIMGPGVNYQSVDERLDLNVVAKLMAALTIILRGCADAR